MDKKINSTSSAPAPTVMRDTLNDYKEYDMNKAKDPETKE